MEESNDMIDAWTDRLSEYADDSLTGEERALLEAHLGTCASCATTLTGLRAVMDRARTLPERAPDVDLWPGIEARIAAFARDTHAAAERSARPQGGGSGTRSFPDARRGLVLSWPQLVAAGLTLVALSGGVSWFAGRSAMRPVVAGRTSGSGETTEPNVTTAATPAKTADGELAGELRQLEQVLAAKRSELGPETVRTIEANLKIIDLATAQAQQALAGDPANPYLQEHLSKTMRKKVDMLRQATVLASAQ